MSMLPSAAFTAISSFPVDNKFYLDLSKFLPEVNNNNKEKGWGGGREESNFIVEKHFLIQRVKVNTNRGKSRWQHVHLTQYEKMALHLCDFPSKNAYPQSNYKKNTRPIPIGGIGENAWQVLSKVSRSLFSKCVGRALLSAEVLREFPSLDSPSFWCLLPFLCLWMYHFHFWDHSSSSPVCISLLYLSIIRTLITGLRAHPCNPGQSHPKTLNLITYF